MFLTDWSVLEIGARLCRHEQRKMKMNQSEWNNNRSPDRIDHVTISRVQERQPYQWRGRGHHFDVKFALSRRLTSGKYACCRFTPKPDHHKTATLYARQTCYESIVCPDMTMDARQVSMPPSRRIQGITVPSTPRASWR